MHKSLPAFILVALLASTTRAENPAPPPMWPVDQFKALLAFPEPTPEARANTARLIRDLTSPDFAIRESASKAHLDRIGYDKRQNSASFERK